MSTDLELEQGPQRILVTGGAVFIGSHLVDAVTSRGRKVTILDNLSTGAIQNVDTHLRNGETRLVKGDVRKGRDAKKAMEEADTVFHMTAVVSVPWSVENPEKTYDVNAEGTRTLLEASLSSDLKRFVYASSCAVYGEPRYLPIDENHSIDPLSPYAESKLRGEKYCREFYEKYGLNTVVLRLFNVYGPRQTNNEYSGVITRFISCLRASKAPTIYGDGLQTRDFVHVSDVVQAFLLSAVSNSAAGQVFNIGSGKSVTINELCQVIISKSASKVEPVYGRPRFGEVKNSRSDIRKAKYLRL